MRKILLIDDDVKIRNIYKQAMLHEGFDVIEAEDARRATFKMIQLNQKIDLVLLDINMPGVDGGVMRQIISEWDPDLKVLVSSVYPVDDQREMIPDAFDYFDKSQGTDVLMEKIKHIFGHMACIHR